jgi:molybdopterin-guanine dinucleotide biosynthesis protein A
MLKTAAVILAGGNSSRMGQDKANVEIKGKTLLAHNLSILNTSNVDEVFISSKTEIPDQVENLGPIGGIISALDQLSSFDLVLFTPIDMPLLTASIYNYLLSRPISTMTFFKNYFMPFLIKNNSEVRSKIRQLISTKQLAIYQLIKELEAHSVEFNSECGVDEAMFINVNTPEQLSMVNKIFNQ